MSDTVILDGELSLTNQLDGQGGTYNRYDWRGYSAYEIAVQHGYTGTEEEWLASLHGADGTDGKDGQDGDDYVITEQDYQNIANLVPVPVTDVQINGTSILSDGVANIPVIGYGKLGIAKLTGNPNLGGLGRDGNGTIYVDRAPEDLIKQGENRFRPIAPQYQHTAAFYGLAKAAGHDEKDSTLPVGQYTEEAKTAIRTMLGIDKASLIAEIRDALGI